MRSRSAQRGRCRCDRGNPGWRGWQTQLRFAWRPVAGARRVPAACVGRGVRVVSLSADDRRALGLIEEEIAASDPRLAAMLSVFNRLADGEAMPGSERIRARRQHGTGESFQATLAARPGTSWRRVGTQRWVLLTWLAVALLLVTLALVASHTGSATSCTARTVAACGNQTPAHRQSQPVHESPG